MVVKKRRPKKKPDVSPEPAGVQINHLAESVESYSKHKIECFLCLKKESARDVSESSFARDLYKSGWRHLVSEKFATIGAMCPECAALPDSERGER